MATDVVDIPESRRFEIRLDGEKAGLIDYRLADGAIELVHTEIDPEHQGEGLASVLVQGALEHIRAGEGLRLVPLCPYVKKWLQRHPEYEDLTTR